MTTGVVNGTTTGDKTGAASNVASGATTGDTTGVASNVASGAPTGVTAGEAAGSVDGVIVADAMTGSVGVAGESYWTGSAAT